MYSIEILNTDKNENIFPGEFDKEEDNKIEEISQKEKNKVKKRTKKIFHLQEIIIIKV